MFHIFLEKRWLKLGKRRNSIGIAVNDKLGEIAFEIFDCPDCEIPSLLESKALLYKILEVDLP